MKNNIRLAAKTDAEKLSQIKINGWKFAYKNLISTNFLNNQNLENLTKDFENRIENGNLKVYLIENKKDILGFIGIKIENNICDLRLLYLKPEEIGKGYGSLLLKYLEEKEIFEKIKFFVLEGNDLGIKFYLKKGFNFNGNKEIFELDGEKYTELEMEKFYN